MRTTAQNYPNVTARTDRTSVAINPRCVDPATNYPGEQPQPREHDGCRQRSVPAIVIAVAMVRVVVATIRLVAGRRTGHRSNRQGDHYHEQRDFAHLASSAIAHGADNPRPCLS
jgi:hypothetical protein